MYQVLITDYPWADLEIETQILEQAGAKLRAAPTQDVETLAEMAADVDAILVCWAEIPDRVLAAAPRCRIVSRLGIGLDNIDVESCTRRGIVVTNVPDYCVREVAEHALALIFALGRRITDYHLAIRDGRYGLEGHPLPARIESQTLGIVGWGNIGRLLGEKAAALGMRVLVHTPRPAPNDQATFVSLPELLQQSDYVSLHAPLNQSTRHLIGAPQLAGMKPTAFLVNTARGGLVDHEALGVALRERQLAGAALDVQDPEPPDLQQAPWNDPRVLITPHAGFLSPQSLEELRHRAARQVADLLGGKQPECVVNAIG